MRASVDPTEKARRWKARIKLFGAMLTTYGYALLAGGAWDPFVKGQPFTLRTILAFGLGVAMHAIALYIAPEGEPT